MAEMAIDRGDRVMAPNGTEIGRVEHVIIDEATRQVTDLVVGKGSAEFLVPMANVARHEAQAVILHAMPAHMATQRPFQPEAYRGVDDAVLDAIPAPPVPGRPTAVHVTNESVVVDDAGAGARALPATPPVMGVEHERNVTERIVMPPAGTRPTPPTPTLSAPIPAPPPVSAGVLPTPPAPPAPSAPESLKDTVTGAVRETVASAKEHVTGAVQETVATTREHLTGSGHQGGGATGPQHSETIREKVAPLIGNVEQSGLVGMIRQNPLPAALIGLGLGWLWMQSRHGAQPGTVMQSHYRPAPRITPEVREYGYGTTPRYAASDRRERDQEVSPRGRAGDTTGWQNQGQGDTSLRERAGDTMAQAKNAVGDVAGSAGDRIGQVASGAQDVVSGFASGAREQAGQFGDGVGSGAQGAQTWFRRSLHDSPLSIAALAFAGGLAVGLRLPDTEWEDRMIGPAREAVRGTVQSAAQDTLQKVQHVASDVGESVKQEVQKQTPELQKQ